tara:strand:- start:5478 stop:6371 length:894 start_codon:yes stop_codon:yes gene_type:complete
MLASLFTSIFFSCGSDIAIITREDKNNSDTSSTVVENIETSEPSLEPGSDSNDDMTDLTIGFASMSLTQIACPACVGVTNEFDISASLKLHQPTNGGYSEWVTPIGNCVTQEIGSHISSEPLNFAGTVNFNAIQLYPTGPSEWSTTNVYEYQIPRRTQINVTTDYGTIVNAFETLEGFDSIEPYTLLWVDPSYAFEAVVSKQGTTFTWYPVISDAQFEILVAVYTPDGSQLLGMVACMENDVGYMTLPGNYFQSYPSWSLAAVYLTRHRITRTPAPDFNGYLESHQTWTVLGTAHIE